MKKTILTKAAMLLLACAVSFTACKKDKKNDPTNDEKIVGKWSLNYVAEDANNNGVMEESEKEAMTTAMSVAIHYMENKTLKVVAEFMGSADSTTGTWAINGDKLYMTQDGDLDSAQIQTLDGTNLIFKSYETPTSWTGLSKQ